MGMHRVYLSEEDMEIYLRIKKILQAHPELRGSRCKEKINLSRVFADALKKFEELYLIS